jgi:hypothetical protein
MKLDVRLPIGAMFALDGLILAGHGLLGGATDAVRKSGLNITLVWGVVLIAFGSTMLALAWRARRA